MSEVTVEITNYCLHNCPDCSSDATRYGKPLEYKKIRLFLINNIPKGREKVPHFDRINISGGEPLSHPNFYEILMLCEYWAKEVVVYTNAIKHIAYNASVLKELKVKANVCLIPDTNIHIPKGNFTVNLLKFIPQGRGKNIKEN